MAVVLWNGSAWIPAGQANTPVPGPWPDATNTGLAGVGLTADDLTVVAGFTAEANTVYELLDITGAVSVPAEAVNVTFRKCRFRGFFFGIDGFESVGLTVEDSDFVTGDNCGLAVGSNATVLRCNISGGSDGMKAGGGLLLQDCYIHDLLFVAGQSHNDGIQFHSITGGNIVIVHNYIASPDTSCIAMFSTEIGTGDDILIQGNYLTGPGYLIYAPGSAGTNVRIMDNTFGVWAFGPVTDWVPAGNVWSGNVRASDGATVNPDGSTTP